MNIEISKSTIGGSVSAPPSKSVSHRAIIAAALSQGTSLLKNVLFADDTVRTINALKKFGVGITRRGSDLVVRGGGGSLQQPRGIINLGHSGTSMRFLTAVAGLVSGSATFTGSPRLGERPMHDLFSSLSQMGILAKPLRPDRSLPLQVFGSMPRGGTIRVSGSISSQFASALLFIAPFAKHATTISVQDPHSRPYIELTARVMEDFGVSVFRSDNHSFIVPSSQRYTGRDYAVEGDYSSSSYFFALAAITKSSITVRGLSPESRQGDSFFLTLLREMGCDVRAQKNSITVTGTGHLSAITADLGDYPDIVQTLAVVSAFAKGVTKIRNIGHLKHKETDRITATALELNAMGVRATHDDHALIIPGGRPRGAVITTHNDHRMAMSFAIAGLGAAGVTTIKNAEVVEKSYPAFFTDLRSLGARAKKIL